MARPVPREKREFHATGRLRTAWQNCKPPMTFHDSLATGTSAFARSSAC